jgi:hypothetical protein
LLAVRRSLLALLCACRYGFDPVAIPDGASPPDVTTGSMTITFGERPTSQRTGVTFDAYVTEDFPTRNRGVSDDLAVSRFSSGSEHALVRFDLSSLAPGTQITGARLEVALLDFGDETTGPVELLLVAESWVEGTGAAGSGATWTTRDGVTAWTTAGGTTTDTIATATPSDRRITFVLPPTIVQGWVDAPATNAGVLLAGMPVGTHVHLHASESGLDEAARPELAVDVAD